MSQAEQRAFRAFVEGTAELVCLLSELGVIEYLSPSVSTVLGWDVDDLVGTNVLQLVHEDDLPAALYAVYGNALAPADGIRGQDGSSTTGEYRLRHKDGHWVALEVLGSSFLLTEGIEGILIVGRDVSARNRLDAALTSIATGPIDNDSLANLASLVDELLRGTATALLVDGRWIASAWSPVPRPPVIDGPWMDAMSRGETVISPAPDEDHRAVWSLPVVDATRREVVGCVVVWSALHDDPMLGWWATLQRVCQLAGLALGRLRAEQAVQHAAAHDPLTGLRNRPGFIAAVDAIRGSRPGAVLLADLDRFKPVNDVHGHTRGDAVLQVVAKRLAGIVRPDDVIGRVGGDEFAVFLADADTDGATEVAARMIVALEAPIWVGGALVHLGVSIGIDAGGPGVSLDQQLSAADTALQRAKRAGRHRLSAFVR